MKAAVGVLLAAGSCATLIAAWLLLRGSSTVEASPEQSAQIQQPAEEQARISETAPELEKPDSRLTVTPTAPPQPEPAAQPPPDLPPPSEFAALLSMPEKSLAEKQAKESAIRKLLGERTMPLIQKRFDAGLADYLYEEQKYSGLPEDEGQIYGVQMPPGGGTYRTVLPRHEHPALYELHDAADRLKQESLALKQQEAAKQAQTTDPTPR